MRTLLIIAACWIASASSVLANLGEAEFRGHEEGYNYDIQVHYKPAPPMPHYPNAPKYWTVIESLRVVINGRSIDVPPAAVNDLFWPHTPQPPYPGPDGTLRFKLGGGSGEYSYEATFVFSKKRLLTREWSEPPWAKAVITKYPVH